ICNTFLSSGDSTALIGFNQGIKDQGDFSLIWNGKDSKGSHCPSGIYLVRMQAGKLVSSSKLMLVR
ncbi:MAG TPA: hypothetical protein PL188_10670, partial [Candidatus Cloacimonadota bacterium]|nr:hypothetical protein [Candidatus Cloacimonadota bacterium]